MKVTKFIHSCLLIEHEDKHVLIDPGEYSVNEHTIDVNTFPKLDYLLITHEHADHFYLPFIKELKTKFPSLRILTNGSVKNILAEHKIETEGTIEGIEMFESRHEKIFIGEAPVNTVFNVFGKLTHTGDSLSFSKTKEVLALPIQAPWGSTTWAVETALKLKPKIIIPIHDWHWNERAREGMYVRLQNFFAGHDIDFKSPRTGEPIEV